MSRENVELVRRFLDAWNRRDLEALVALSDPEVEYVNSPTAVEPGTRHGVDATAEVAQTQWEILLDGHAEIDRVFDRGDEVITLGRLSRRVGEGEARLEDRLLVFYRIREGKFTRVQVLGFGADEVDSAMTAAGLLE